MQNPGTRAEQRRWQEALEQTAGLRPDSPGRANAFPSDSNDRVLAKYIKELEDKDVEFQRMRDEESREQWRALARQNYQRQKMREEDIAFDELRDQVNQQKRDDIQTMGLLAHVEELRAAAPSDKTLYTMPLDMMRDIIKTQQELALDAERRGIRPSPQPTQQTAPPYRQSTVDIPPAQQARNEEIAGGFLEHCPDFPRTPQAVEALGRKIVENGWDFSPESVIAAHHVCQRENLYE